jgi:hypothetical protein
VTQINRGGSIGAHKVGGGPKKASAVKDMVALGAKGRAAFGIG